MTGEILHPTDPRATEFLNQNLYMQPTDPHIHEWIIILQDNGSVTAFRKQFHQVVVRAKREPIMKKFLLFINSIKWPRRTKLITNPSLVDQEAPTIDMGP